jgi:hypothetical protein
MAIDSIEEQPFGVLINGTCRPLLLLMLSNYWIRI